MNPGSPEAVAAGCSCPVIDNGRGKGVWGGSLGDDGKPMFWMTVGCKVHHSDIDADILAAHASAKSDEQAAAGDVGTRGGGSDT